MSMLQLQHSQMTKKESVSMTILDHLYCLVKFPLLVNPSQQKLLDITTCDCIDPCFIAPPTYNLMKSSSNVFQTFGRQSPYLERYILYIKTPILQYKGFNNDYTTLLRSSHLSLKLQLHLYILQASSNIILHSFWIYRQ